MQVEVRDEFVILGSEDPAPWRRAQQPTPVFLPGESHGQRACQAAVHRVKQSWTGLRQLSTCFLQYC